MPQTSAVDAARRIELQRLLGDACELRGLIGRGGFADVFEAWDKRLKRELAVKTLRTDLDLSDALLERFRREAEAIAQLRHPNVIPIYTVGGEGSVAYFVMPKIAGESLAATLQREGTIAVRETCRMLREAAGALGAAHRAGMVHRDVKPENIMLDGATRHVLVMDFGIAKSVGTGGTELTQTGMAIGTPQYMSPEQAFADRTLDHRSDQYSLAVVGYRMLSGRLPFGGDSFQSVLMRQVSAPPVPLREVAPEVPAAVAAVIERALSKEPGDRFESMEAFAAALESATSALTPRAVRRARAEDMDSRISAMRAALRVWRGPAAFVAAAALVVLVWLTLRSPIPMALALAANRDDAVFAARTFASKHGLEPPLLEVSKFEDKGEDPDDFRFLKQNLNAAAITQYARDTFPIWLWHVQLRPMPGAVWPMFIDVGPSNAILRFHRLVSDTVTASTIPAARAESIAVAELASHGWNVAELRRLSDSSVTLANRTDRIFRWLRPGTAIPWHGDTAFSQLRVHLIGPTVLRYSQALVAPRNYDTKRYSENSQDMALKIALALAGLALFAWLMVKQLGRDDLQWAMGLRFGAIVTLAVIPAWVTADAAMAASMRGLGLPGLQPLSEITGGLALNLLFGLSIVPAAAVAESLSTELRPSMFAGIPDLVSGHFRTPEFVTAVATGVLGGLLFGAGLLIVDETIQRVTHELLTPEVTPLVWASVPTLEMLAHLGDQLATVLMLGLAQLAVFKWRRSGAMAVWLPIAMFALVQFLPISSDTMGERWHSVFYLIGLSVIVWRYGILAGAFAEVLRDGIPAVLWLYRYGNGRFVSATLAAAVLALPLVLAVITHRRFAMRHPARVV